MLPDFPKVRKFADEILMSWFRRRVFQKSGVMQDIPAEVLHEGNRVELHRYDGSVQVISMKPTASELRLEKNEFQKKGLGAVIVSRGYASPREVSLLFNRGGLSFT